MEDPYQLPAPLTFLLPAAADLEALRRADPDRDSAPFVHGEHAWILQTYLRLHRAGESVELAAEPPPDAGWIVYHAGDRRAVGRRTAGRRDLVLVCVRGDRHRVWQADFEVVQNRVAAGGRRHFVPHWPQPALVPRDPERGDRVENVVFKGFERNLAPAFRDPSWAARLAAEGLRWRVDATRYEDYRGGGEPPDWADYRSVDAVLAVRPPAGTPYPRKPATKLYNAWFAGVPCLLGPEIAFREMRRSDLDYLEVSTPEEALAALRRLRDEPRLYRSMVEHGRKRAEALRPERIVERWKEALAAMAEDRRGRGVTARAVDRVRSQLRGGMH